MRHRQYIYWYFRNFKFELKHDDIDLYKGFMEGSSLHEREGRLTIYNLQQLFDMCMNDSCGRMIFRTETDINKISARYTGRENDYVYLHRDQFNIELGCYEA